MSSTPFHEHLLEAPDVCANCFSLIREERVDPTRSGFGRDYESTYTRRRETTEIGYGPARTPSESKGVFCQCGVESHRVQHRVWDYTELSRERFKQLLQNAVRTLERKGVTIAQKTLVGHAIQAYDAGANVDGAIEAGLDAGLAVATTQRATAD